MFALSLFLRLFSTSKLCHICKCKLRKYGVHMFTKELKNNALFETSRNKLIGEVLVSGPKTFFLVVLEFFAFFVF